MEGPWYEEQGPTLEIVITDMKREFNENDPKIIEKLTKQISKEFDNKFGSWRGYTSSAGARPELIEKIKKQL